MKKQLLLAFSTAILLSLAYAPLRTGFFAYVGLIPFFYLLESSRGRSETIRWSYFTGFCYALGTLYWIGWVTFPGMIGTLLVWPLYIVLYGGLHVRLRRIFAFAAWLFLPFVWVAIEYLQSLSELAFPWNYIGYTQSYFLPLVQYVEYTSVLGVSFWILLINSVGFLALSHKAGRRRYLVLMLLLFILPLVQGLWSLHHEPAGEQVTASLLQGNMDPFEKWADDEEKNMLLYEGLMEKARQQRPEMYIWPETATPFYLQYEPGYLERMHQLVDSSRAPILTGSVDAEHHTDGSYKYFNAALFFTGRDSLIQRYAKIKLVPFSERVPYRDYFPFRQIKALLYDLVWGIGDYTPGDEYTLFHFTRPAGVCQFAVPICYESAFPAVVRTFCRNGADFLVVITNDAWFGRTSGPYQHARIAVFRAIENRIGIARCANTGISCFIDPCGRVSQTTALDQKVVLTGNVVLRHRTTWYTRHGDLFAWLCVLISATVLIASMVTKTNK